MWAMTSNIQFHWSGLIQAIMCTDSRFSLTLQGALYCIERAYQRSLLCHKCDVTIGCICKPGYKWLWTSALTLIQWQYYSDNFSHTRNFSSYVDRFRSDKASFPQTKVYFRWYENCGDEFTKPHGGPNLPRFCLVDMFMRLTEEVVKQRNSKAFDKVRLASFA